MHEQLPRVMVLGLRGFPEIQGGVERHAESLYPRLVELGCRVEVLGRAPYRPPAGLQEWRGVRLHWLWAPKVKGVEALAHSLFGVIVAAAKRPDVLHIHAIGPALFAPLARLLGLTVVVTHHGPDYERQKWGRFAKALLRLGERSGMLAANERIAISQGIRALVRSKYHVDSTVIPNGVEPIAPVATFGALDRFGLSQGRYVLQVSRLVPEKRQLDLIAAFHRAELQGWKLVLVGDTEFPDGYSAAVRSAATASSNVVCTGFQSGRSLAELYSHAGLFVLPSSHEGLPIALLEALAYGLPVMASDIAPNLEVGLPAQHYFPLEDIDALATALRSFAQQPSVQSAVNSAEIMRRYNWDQVAEETLAVYRSSLARSLPKDAGSLDRNHRA